MDLKKKLWFRPEWIVAVLITLAACALHFYYWLHIGALWRDEVNLIVLSHRHSFAEMARDSFPILMPLIVRFWFAIGLGGSDIHLRLIGLMVGLGTVAALWVGMWKIRREPPLIGLVLLGLNSTMIFFGDSLRAYGLGSVVVIMLTASAFVFLKKPSALRAAWLALFAVLSVQVLYHNAVLVAAVCFGAWAVCWRRADGRAAVQILIVAIVSAASLLPYARILGGFASNNAAALVFRTGATMRRFIWSCDDVFGFPLWGYKYVWAGLAVMIIVCACAGLRRQIRAKRSQNEPKDGSHQPGPAIGRSADLEIGDTAGLETCGTVPQKDFSLFAAVTLLFSAIVFPIFFWRAQMPMQSWYLLPFMAAAVVCFDGARPVFPGLLWSVFIGLVAGTALVSTWETASRFPTPQFSNVKIFARELEESAGPNDYILVYPWNWGITFNHYYNGATPWNTVPPLSDHSIHRVDLVLAQMENTNALAPVRTKISQALESGHRVWFLGFANTQLPAPGTPPVPSPPPPPTKYFGWSEIPYSAAWGRQTLEFIADHSMKFRQFKYPSYDVYLTENMDLYVAEGWRTNSLGDESSAFADFQQSVQAADPGAVENGFKHNHSSPPTKQAADEMVAGITSAAMAVMDKAADFEKRFPQSKQLLEIQQSLTDTLILDFGSMGLPIPKSRASDVEACTRKLLTGDPDNAQLYMVLCRVASRLPASEQHALYEELSGGSTPEPARSMAKHALRELGRLGVPLDFSFNALDGRFVNLANLRGKVVLVDFWSTTCVPCVREIPDLKKLQDKYQAAGLEVIGISLDTDKESLQRFIKRDQISWPQFYDSEGMTNRLAREFDIGSIPVVWLIDRRGILRDLNAREDEEAKVEALLDEPPAAP